MTQLFYNGQILTMDDAAPQGEAVLIRDGKIQAVGSRESVMALKEEDTQCVDLQGKTMLPGFIDGHSHFAGFAASLAQCDLSQVTSLAQMVETLQKFLSENRIPEGQWVVGTNYDHNFLEEGRHPDKFLLDQVSTDHPVVVIHASSHMGVTNSLGLSMEHLTEDTPDPAGGRYGRVGGSRELDGYMEENAFVAFRNAMPMPDIQAFMELFRKAQQIYAGYGITTIQEGMVTKPLMALLDYGAQKRVLYLDLVGYPDLENCQELLQQKERFSYHNHLRLGGCKIFLDGSPQGRTAWMRQPYENASDGYRGYPIHTDEDLHRLILTALENHWQVLAHCNGDAAAQQYIDVFRQVQQEHPQLDACRPVMIHAQLVGADQLAEMAKIPMSPSFFVAHTYHWGDIHIANFGMERASRISPAATAQKLGLPFTFHQDSPVLPPDVLGSIWCTAKRITKSGQLLDQQERVSVYEGLKAATVYGAWQYGEEDAKGTIQPGKLADLVILDQNPLTVPLDQVKSIQVLATFKEGRLVFRR